MRKTLKVYPNDPHLCVADTEPKDQGKNIPTVLLSIVETWRIWAFENPDAHQYHWNSHVAVRKQENTFYARAMLYSDLISAVTWSI